MPRYIDKDKLVNKLKEDCETLVKERWFDDYVQGYSSAIDDIIAEPTADVQEVKHGHWIKFKIQDGVYEHMKCSNCSFYWSMSQHSNIFLRCPHCGAFMDEEEKQ